MADMRDAERYAKKFVSQIKKTGMTVTITHNGRSVVINEQKVETSTKPASPESAAQHIADMRKMLEEKNK